jgi:hypothetical protein
LRTPVAVNPDSTCHVPPEGIQRRYEATIVVLNLPSLPGMDMVRGRTGPLQCTDRSGFTAARAALSPTALARTTARTAAAQARRRGDDIRIGALHTADICISPLFRAPQPATVRRRRSVATPVWANRI